MSDIIKKIKMYCDCNDLTKNTFIYLTLDYVAFFQFLDLLEKEEGE